VLHHVHGDDRTRLANEIRRVLSPAGLCCIIEHNPWNPVTRAIVKRCPVDVDAELLSARQANNLLGATGFKLVELDYFLYLPEKMFRSIGVLENMLSKVPMGGQYAMLGQLSA